MRQVLFYRLLMPAAFIVLTLAVPSCGFDDTELKNSLSELEQRIDMLEDYSEQIRSDIESLQEIVKKTSRVSHC